MATLAAIVSSGWSAGSLPAGPRAACPPHRRRRAAGVPAGEPPALHIAWQHRAPALAILLTLLVTPVSLTAQVNAAPPIGVATPEPSAIVGAPSGSPLAGAALETETKRVASLLRCPVCQGLSVFDSPSDMARNMKGEVRDLLARGFTGDQILRYFESSYGEFVRLEPPRRGFNWIVWLAPAVALLGGGVVVLAVLRRKKSRQLPIPSVIDPDLDPYLAAVRRAAYGEGDSKAAGTEPHGR